MPPETLRRKWYHKVKRTTEIAALPPVPSDQITKVDIYAFGLIMWEICTQEEVFLQFNDIDAFCEAVCDKNIRPKIDLPNVPPLLGQIMDTCWTKEAKSRLSFKDLVPRIEHTRIKTILDFPSEISFWHYYWPTKPKVPFDEFMKILFRKNPKIDIDRETFQKILNVTTHHEVTLTGYKRLLEWFGPLNEGTLLDQMIDILKAKWFHPTYSAKEAEGHLILGSYLVRLNFGDTRPITPAPFTISFRAENGPCHSRINRNTNATENNKYQVYINNKFSSPFAADTLQDLIDLLCKRIPIYFKIPVEVTQTNYVETTIQNEFIDL